MVNTGTHRGYAPPEWPRRRSSQWKDSIGPVEQRCTNANYSSGLLTARADSDLLAPDSWSKSPTAVFTSDATASQYGPGHNSFTVAEDGHTDVLVYHARQFEKIIGDPLNDPNRHALLQNLGWNDDGSLHFGAPVADGPYDPRGQQGIGG